MKILSIIKNVTCSLFVYPISFLFPRNKKIWLFGSNGGKFYDNSKYLYLWCSLNKSDVRSVWLGGNNKECAQLNKLNFEAYPRRSIKGLILRAISKVYIYSSYVSDIGYSLSGGAYKINLWHGVGVKKIEFLIDSGPLKNIFKEGVLNYYKISRPQHFVRPDLMVCPSTMMKNHFMKAFRITENNTIMAGYPRNDVYVNEELKKICNYINNYESIFNFVKDKKKIFMYAPTWRNDGFDILTSAIKDFSKLNLILKKNDYALIIKCHPNQEIATTDVFSNIIIWPNNLDVYPFAEKVNILVTDYSSMYYDFMKLKNIEFWFYIYDIDFYIKNSNDFAFPFMENVDGLFINDFNDLCDKIKNYKMQNNIIKNETLCKKFWETKEESSCEKIYNEIKNFINK